MGRLDKDAQLLLFRHAIGEHGRGDSFAVSTSYILFDSTDSQMNLTWVLGLAAGDRVQPWTQLDERFKQVFGGDR